ncbi:MAG: hypothetical protein ACRC5A_13545, partial [Enterobacteriaceae bacterium]
GAVVVLVVLANDHLIMITAHFPLFFLKIRHFFYRYQLVDPKDPTYKFHLRYFWWSECHFWGVSFFCSNSKTPGIPEQR